MDQDALVANHASGDDASPAATIGALRMVVNGQTFRRSDVPPTASSAAAAKPAAGGSGKRAGGIQLIAPSGDSKDIDLDIPPDDLANIGGVSLDIPPNNST